MPIASEELYEYLVQEGYKKADGGVLAEHMREFSRNYYHETRTSPAMVYALWECFKQSRETVKLLTDLENCSKQPPFRYVEEDGRLYRYNSKKEVWTEVKDSYFRNILKKAFKVEIDKEGIQWVHLNNQKKLRLRKQKV
jgi:hypothetical protein